ncbi:MAG: polysaccharide export protein EpsE [Burkholderiaceae bacterium]
MNSALLSVRRQPGLILCLLLMWCASVFAQTAPSPPSKSDYTLGAGDTVRVQVFQNPDLSIEARVSESGSISFPLIGAVELGGLSIAAGEKKIADALQKGGYIQKPQVNIVLLQIRGSQVAVLGHVAKPGRFPLETVNTRLSDVLAMAGGATPTGDDVVIITGTRAGQTFRKQVDVPFIYLAGQSQDNLVIQGGDTVYVARAPMFYIYGEVQRPGAFRIERGMTVMQALAQGGGPTARGSERRLRLHRTQDGGRVVQSVPQLTDMVQANDVIYVSESIF